MIKRAGGDEEQSRGEEKAYFHAVGRCARRLPRGVHVAGDG